MNDGANWRSTDLSSTAAWALVNNLKIQRT